MTSPSRRRLGLFQHGKYSDSHSHGHGHTQASRHNSATTATSFLCQERTGGHYSRKSSATSSNSHSSGHRLSLTKLWLAFFTVLVIILGGALRQLYAHVSPLLQGEESSFSAPASSSSISFPSTKASDKQLQKHAYRSQQTSRYQPQQQQQQPQQRQSLLQQHSLEGRPTGYQGGEAAFKEVTSSSDGGATDEDENLTTTTAMDLRYPPRIFTCRCYPQVKLAFAKRGFSMKRRPDDYTNAWMIWKTGTDIDAKRLEPWQRPNHFPGERQMDRKGTMYQVLRQYANAQPQHNEVGGKLILDFLPETYLLYTEEDKQAFVQRLSADDNNNSNDHSSGMDQPWVLKRATASRGRGVTMLGPQSTELATLRDELRDGPIKRGHIVQSYIQNEWTYQGHKCDLRVYVVVASVDPLIVYYHDGIVRTAAGLHNEDDFAESKAHLTNVSQNKQNRTAWEPVKTFDDLEAELNVYVQKESSRRPNLPINDPTQYIRDQIKHIISIVFAAFKSRISLDKIPVDNAFAVMGADFVIDQDLKVWLLEMQLGPQLLGDNHKAKTAVLQDVLTTTIDVVEEVYQKQVHGQPVLPLQKTSNLELVYADQTYMFAPPVPK